MHKELIDVSLRFCVYCLAANPCKSDKYLKDPYSGKIDIIALNLRVSFFSFPPPPFFFSFQLESLIVTGVLTANSCTGITPSL